MHGRHSRAGGKIAALAGLFSLPLTVAPAFAVCLWADVGGEKLGVVGRITGPYNTAQTTLERTLDLDTQSTGQAVFFGYVANQVKLTRKGQDGRDHVYDFGTVAREMTGGGWTKHGDLSGKHTYQPSWMLMQSPLVTRVYACQPHKGAAGDFRMTGGQGAQWSTNPRPWINDVKYYRDTRVKMEVTGYGVVWQGVNYNFVSMIRVDDRWPCEIMKDFSLPTGAMAIKGAQSGNSVDIQWDTEWGCGTGTGPAPDTRNDIPEGGNRPPTVTLKATPDRGEPTLTATFTATGIDPDGDPVEYRFKPPGGQWTEWGPGNSITVDLADFGTHTAEVEVADIKGLPGGKAKANATVEQPEVYIFGNHTYPVSTWRSARGVADYSQTLAQEYSGKHGSGSRTDWGGVFNRLSPEAKRASDTYGGMFGKMVVIDKNGGLVGVYDTPQFLSLNKGFSPGQVAWQYNFNTYKGRIAALPGGQQVRVLENAMHSPLIVDLDGDGKPDLLAGRGWQTPRHFSPDLTHYREVDLDGKGPSMWEWVGPRDALLVDLKQLEKDPRRVGAFVFGNSSWGGRWTDGFSALRQLDGDRSGTIDGEELSRIGLWTDKNGDAKVGEDEVFTAKDMGIDALKTKPGAESPPGNYMNLEGAVVEGGGSLAVWDWWAAASPLGQLTERGKVRWTKGPADVPWGVSVTGADSVYSDGSLDMARGGRLTFYQSRDGAWFVRVQSEDETRHKVDMIYPVNQLGEFATWGIGSGSAEATSQIFWQAGRLIGLTVVNDGRYATWKVVEHTGVLPLPSQNGAGSGETAAR